MEGKRTVNGPSLEGPNIGKIRKDIEGIMHAVGESLS